MGTRKRWSGWLAVLLVLSVVLAGTVAARTYYVAPADSNATDDGEGTAEQPFRHVLKANSVVQAGDTVIIADGVYHEFIAPQDTGSATAWITYRPEHWHGAVFDGLMPLADAADPAQPDWERDPQNPDKNIWFRVLLRPSFTEAWRDGERMPYAFEYYHGVDCGPWHMAEGRCVMQGDSLYVWLEEDVTPDSIQTWEVSISNGVSLLPLGTNLHRYVRVEGFVFQNFGRNGILVEANNVVIRDNLTQYNGRSGIAVNFCGNDTIVVEDNVARYNCGGIGFTQGITVYDATGPDILLRRNIAHDNIDGGPCGTDGNGFVIDNCGATGGAILVNNVAFHNDGGGFGIYQSSNVRMVNNTSFDNFHEGGEWASEFHLTGTDSVPCNHIVLRNNIMAVRSGVTSQTLSVSYREGSPPVDVQIDHNLHFRWPDSDEDTRLIHFTWRTADSQQGVWLNLDEYQSFDWHGLSGLGEGAVFASPLLTDYAYGNFRLEAGSPAIDAGASGGAPTADFFGTTRGEDGEGYDIGAYEYADYTAAPDAVPPPLLLSCYPNPANPAVTVRFSLAQRSPVELRVRDMLGRTVRSLVQQTLPAGDHDVRWDGRRDDGVPAGTGVYLVDLRAGTARRGVKVILVR